MYTIIPWATSQRAVFYRERAAGMYSTRAHIVATVVELPYIFVESAIGINIMYWMCGFSSDVDKFLYFWLLYFLYITLLTHVGMLFSALTPDAQSGTLLAALFYQIINLFAGTQVPPSDIPLYYKWLYWLSPQRWGQEGVIATQFHGDSTIICNPMGVQYQLVTVSNGTRSATMSLDALPSGLRSFYAADSPIWNTPAVKTAGWATVVGGFTTQVGALCGASNTLAITSSGFFIWVKSITPDNTHGSYPGLTDGVVGQAVDASTYVLDQFLDGYKYDFRWYDIIVLTSWLIATRMLLVVVTAKVNHLKR